MYGRGESELYGVSDFRDLDKRKPEEKKRGVPGKSFRPIYALNKQMIQASLDEEFGKERINVLTRI